MVVVVVVVPQINLSVVMYKDALVVALPHISESANWKHCVVPDFTIRSVAQKVMFLLSPSLPPSPLPLPFSQPASNKCRIVTFWVINI
jgi:hypothetical protein